MDRPSARGRAPTATDGPPGRAGSSDRASRVAGGLLVVVGLVNAVVAVVALVARAPDVSSLVAVALLLAGLATAVLGRLVHRGHRRATLVGLVVFELLLVPRVVAIDDASGPEWVSLAALLVLVVALGVAVWSQRRRERTAGVVGAAA